MNILLDNQPISYSESDLPMLIHGADGSGASFFSVVLSVQYFQSGSKLVFFTAFPMARQEFLRQVGEDNTQIGITETEDDIARYENKKVLIVLSGNQELFIRTLQNLPDAEERVIVVKNIEEYGVSVFDEVLKYEKVMFSGDWDKCVYRETLRTKSYSSRIFFSKSEFINVELPVLEKRVGYFDSEGKSGMVTLNFS